MKVNTDLKEFYEYFKDAPKNESYFNYLRIVLKYKLMDTSNIDTSYWEDHHIKPNSFGGSEHPDNMVLLPPSMHCQLHIEILGFTKDEDFNSMNGAANFFKINGTINPDQYEQLVISRLKYSKKYKWVHISGIEEYASVLEMLNKYNNLTEKGLRGVTSGYLNSHNKWFIDYIKKRKKPNKFDYTKKYDFYHSEIGYIFKSVNELISEFELLKHDITKLTRLINKGLNGSVKNIYTSYDYYKKGRYNWVHKNHGKIFCTATELINKFKNLKLNIRCLESVSSGAVNQHLGWCIDTLYNEDGTNKVKCKTGYYHNYYNKNYSLYYSKQIGLIKKYINDNIKEGDLSGITNGRRRHTKGWYCLKHCIVERDNIKEEVIRTPYQLKKMEKVGYKVIKEFEGELKIELVEKLFLPFIDVKTFS